MRKETEKAALVAAQKLYDDGVPFLSLYMDESKGGVVAYTNGNGKEIADLLSIMAKNHHQFAEALETVVKSL